MTSATRTPRFCWTRELMITVPASLALPPSAYIGTSCISMYGDLPGLSNFWPGTIGSCQYSTFLPVAGSTSPGFCAPVVDCVAGTVAPMLECMP